MLAEAKGLLALFGAQMEQPYVKPADVLVVYDMDAFNYVRPAKADRLTRRITEAMSDSLLGTGVALDRIFLMDLPRVDLSRYKLVIFGNVFVLNDAQRAYIKSHVIRPGRSVVFMSGAGYSDGQKNDVGLISDLTGMQIEKAAGPSSAVTVTLGGQSHTMDAEGLVSLFQVKDQSATSIGVFKSGAVAAAAKTVQGCNVYYFGVPLKADLAFFKTLVCAAGARTYVENSVEQDYVTVGGGIVGIYSVKGGEKTIRPLDGSALKIRMDPFTTRYFDVQHGQDILARPSEESR